MSLEIDGLLLAGGRVGPEMAARTGTPVRALFPWRGRPFIDWAVQALAGCGLVGRIAVVGPPELRSTEAAAHTLVSERDSIHANLRAGLEALAPAGRVLVAATDNPVLSAAAVADFLRRSPEDAGVAYPVLRHQTFVERFPGATNTPVRLRDSAWIGGACVLLRADSLSQIEETVRRVLDARKSLWRMVGLLGPVFAARFALRLAGSDEVERTASRIAGVAVRFVRDCDPAFAIDIDEPEDWEYLHRWAAAAAPSTGG